MKSHQLKSKNTPVSLRELIAQNENKEVVLNDNVIDKSLSNCLDKIPYEKIKPYISKETLLLMASIEGDIDTIKLLLKDDTNMNIKNVHRDTPLLLASKYGHTQIVELLLKHGTVLE